MHYQTTPAYNFFAYAFCQICSSAAKTAEFPSKCLKCDGWMNSKPLHLPCKKVSNIFAESQKIWHVNFTQNFPVALETFWSVMLHVLASCKNNKAVLHLQEKNNFTVHTWEIILNCFSRLNITRQYVCNCYLPPETVPSATLYYATYWPLQSHRVNKTSKKRH